MFDLIGKTVGPYRILEEIGSGGMATVYKAYQPNMDRYIAVKVLPIHLSKDPEFAKRFQREARAIARLEHSHILPVYDYGEYEGITYIAMRYIKAGTLKDQMYTRRLSLEEINHLISQIGGALDYAHRMGVIHRDIKPANVLIDDQGDVYLSDFGLARMMEPTQQLTESGVGLGTPAYMSPEQGQGIKVDHRSDIYSLGVILYEMLTGRVPYEAETPMAVVLKHITNELPLPRTINPNVPEPVEHVILKSLAKDPNDRYQTAGELVQALTVAVRNTSMESVGQPGPSLLIKAPATREHEDASLITRLQQVWAQPRGKVTLVGGMVAVLVTIGILLNQLPGNVAIVSSEATATTSIIAQATSTPVEPTIIAPTPTAELPISSSTLKWEQLYDGASFLPVALNSLAVDPNDPNTIFAGTVGAGIYISRDTGITWELSNEGLGKGTVGSIAIDPNDSNVVYAGLFDKGGLYKSTDGGRTWQAAHKGIDLDNGSTWLGLIRIDPTNSQHLYYTGSDNLYQSIDGGISWRQQTHDCPLAMDIAIDTADGDHLYVASRISSEECPAGVYETRDGGRTWIQLTTNEMAQESGDWWHVAADPRNFDTLYAGSWFSTYKSSDGGKTWRRIYDDGCRWLAVHPDNGSVYCGRQGQLYISHDEGESWEGATFGPDWGNAAERFPFALVPGTQTLYAGTDAVMRSPDGGRTWNFITSFSLPRMRLTVDPRDGNRLFLGGWPGINYDTPCDSYRSDDGGNSWKAIVLNSIGGCLLGIDPLSSTMYRTGGWEKRLYRSTDHGDNWQLLENELLAEDSNNIPHIVPHPGEPTKLWLITEGPGFYLSEDGGQTFASPDDISPEIWQAILLIHPNGQRLYLVSHDAFYRSDDAGESWRLVSHPGGLYRAGAVNPSNPDIVYIGSTHKGMLKSRNGGRSWSPLSNLPAASINDIAIDPTNPQTLYAATDSGAFVSLDGGEEWSRIQDGLGPNPIVYSIAIDPNDSSKVYAVTPDGIYRLEGSLPTSGTSVTSACPELDPSQVKPRSKPAILFDEAHGNGLSLTEEKARQIDPRTQLFPYAGDLADFIRQQGYAFEAIDTGSFSLTNLSNYDLLISSVSIFRQNFNPCEIEAIVAFVKNGGGLLIFGDGDFSGGINTLLKPIGIEMTNHPVVHTKVEELPENFWVTDFSGHPSTGSTAHAWFNWGTSIEILDESWSVLMNSPRDTWLDKNNNRVVDLTESSGPFVLGAAREYGKGRIIVYGDNNVWDYYSDPNYPMYLSMIQWVIGDPTRTVP